MDRIDAPSVMEILWGRVGFRQVCAQPQEMRGGSRAAGIGQPAEQLGKGPMRFALFSLIKNSPEAVSGAERTAHRRFRQVIDEAVFAEQLGFDAYGVGERHSEPYLSTAPPVVLAAVAEHTRRMRLLSTVTVISLLDPVRVAEDYATLDQLSGGRLELMIGKGNDARDYPMFGLDADRRWEYQEEKFVLLRRLLHESDVTWSGKFRPPLHGVTVLPRPFRPSTPIWHGSSSSPESTELAARFGDPLFTANLFHPKKRYADLVDHYRERWVAYGRDPADALVGSGADGLFVAPTSQAAVDGYRPYFDARARSALHQRHGSPYRTVEEIIDGGSALVGSPQQVIDKIADYHASFRHEVLALSVDALNATDSRAVLELFAAEVMPVVRRELPSTVWDDKLGSPCT
ncbi:LLM class flavin-dependent oxidoreductase [Pseudonocardia xinjiangensis]|uniref:LLM class flavin-dependent oxidoreductase n=1 Tax=Pseudonocardia xinjiangensis TaxID=75289 RepID=UPI003D9098EB